MTSPYGGPPTLTIGQAVGQAEACLTRLLTGALTVRVATVVVRLPALFVKTTSY